MKKVLFALALPWAMVGCSDEGAAHHALMVEGYRNIRTTGWAMFGCGKDDGTCTGFTAIGPSGAPVEGVVGCGWWLKGCTVRIK